MRRDVRVRSPHQGRVNEENGKIMRGDGRGKKSSKGDKRQRESSGEMK